MRVYDLKDEEGRTFAFEVDNFWLGRMGVIRIVSAMPDTQIVGRPSLSWFGPDVFCKFEVDGILFEALEPFGDSSRYWIGPEQARWAPQIETVRETFMKAKRYPF